MENAMSAERVAALTPQEAVIFLMVMAGASDGRITDRELRTIGRVVRSFPLFSEADEQGLVDTAEACGALMGSQDGMHKVLAAAAAAIPSFRVLELVRNTLKVGDEGAQSIERAARARHMTLDGAA
jgi:hypothetical protein